MVEPYASTATGGSGRVERRNTRPDVEIIARIVLDGVTRASPTEGAGNRPSLPGVQGTVALGRLRLEDDELISRSRAGDTAAYESLVRRYQDVALRAAYLVAPEADAADAVQDAFVKAYAALSRFRDGEPIKPWLLRIVVNEGRNRRRSAERRSGLARRAALAEPRDAIAASPEAEVLAAETRDLLLAAVGRLRDEDREVIGARYLLDLSEAETAEAIGIRRGTVKSRTSRALARLRDAMTELDRGAAND
jgi:RNA polymerase sigma factor (sigma-70 family)